MDIDLQAVKQIKQWIFKQHQPPLGICFAQDSMTLVALSENHAPQVINFKPGSQHKLAELVKEKDWVSRDCIGVLTPSHYQCFLLEKPNVPEKELMQAIRWRLAELMEDDLDDIALDYLELPQKSRLASNYIYVIAANKSAIKEMVSSLRLAGLNPIGIDIAECAVARLYSKNKQHGLKPKVILHQQNGGIHCQIIKDNHVVFIRKIDLNLQDKTKELESLCHELALHIQRSLDYCSSNISDMSNAWILIEPIPAFESLKHRLQDILGLSVDSLFSSTSIQPIANYELIVACGGAMRELP